MSRRLRASARGQRGDVFARPTHNRAMSREKTGQALREAIVTSAAALATMLCALAIDREPGPAIMAVVLSLALARSHLDLDARGRIEAAVVLPIVALLAFGVGHLLHSMPWAGAAVFVAGLSLPIALRPYGAPVRRAARLVALPLVVILTTPHAPSQRLSPAMALALPVIVAELALVFVSLSHAIARRIGWLPPPMRSGDAPMNARASTMKPSPSTRMAIQMAVALAASFVVGFVLFPGRWAWIVLTAYIVAGGNQGRLDVAYKSALRIVGAAAGTAFALVFAMRGATSGTTNAMLILGAMFLGIWLRPLGYAWWALFVTIALSLLQGFADMSPGAMLTLRLEEILIGAAIAIVSAMFVLPVRSSGVLRRRIADALAALAEAIDPATSTGNADAFRHAVARVADARAPFDWQRRLTARFVAIQPADWIDALVALRAPAAGLIERGNAPARLRGAVGSARKAMREPASIAAALAELHGALDRDETRPARETTLANG
jgi:hypothetical protein